MIFLVLHTVFRIRPLYGVLIRSQVRCTVADVFRFLENTILLPALFSNTLHILSVIFAVCTVWGILVHICYNSELQRKL